jgi:hypothetical protein
MLRFRCINAKGLLDLKQDGDTKNCGKYNGNKRGAENPIYIHEINPTN